MVIVALSKLDIMDSALSLSSLKDKISSKLSTKSKSRSDAKPTSNGVESVPSKQGSVTAKKEKYSKSEEIGASSEPSKSSSKSKSGGKTTSDDSMVLRREAFAFGATEDDLKLIEDLEDDESEIEFGLSTNEKGLTTDISKFMRNIGLSGDHEIVVEDDDENFNEEDVRHPEERKDKESATNNVNDSKQLASSGTKGDTTTTSNSEKHERANNHNQESKNGVQSKDKEKPSSKVPTSDYNVNSVNSEKLLIYPRVDWYNCELDLPEVPEKTDRFAVERLTEKAKAGIEQENKTYLEEFASNNSQRKFLSQILADGTLNDKISALTLLVQEAPLHNMKALDTLLYYCEKKSRTAALQAINALKDLFLNGLLPDRKLVSFAKQSLAKDMSSKTLIVFYFEDYLKKTFFKFIQVLESLSHDPILHVRMNVVSHIFDLLKAKPEQEANLLRLGVNKLGDVEKKVSAKTSYQILQLEETHPAMKQIIIDAVTDMVIQKGNDYHSHYYTILTLNQTILSRTDVELANSLVKTYFSLFERILVESEPALKDKVDDKVLGKSEKGRKNSKRSFKKGKKGGRSVKAEEMSEEDIVEERSAKMFSALLTGLNRAFPFSDLPSETFLNHLNTLYKITHSTNFNTAVQALVLVQQIVSQQDLDSDRYYRTLYESLMDPRLVNSSKQGIYLNLLFKSMKNDIRNVARVLAFVKRILQVCCHWLNVGAIIGMFYLLMELTKTHPQILELMEAEAGRPDVLTEETTIGKETAVYDSKKRNPTFANAQNTCMWEIHHFTNHFHPSVAIYASSLVEGKSQQKPDLGLFTLAHFLDKFVYKNAKQKTNLKGSSVMQPLGGGHLGSLLVRATNIKSIEMPVNTIDWLSKRADEVKPDERFFYNYFTNNSSKIRGRNKSSNQHNTEEEEDLAEDQVWDALVKSRPDVEGSDDDDGFSDFDDEDFGSMSEIDDDVVDAADPETSFVALSGEESESHLTDSSDSEINEDEFVSFDQGQNELSDMDEETSYAAFDAEIDQFEEGEEHQLSRDNHKRKSSDEGKKKKKIKLSSLPTFASVEDYSEYLHSDDDGLQ